MQGGQNEALQEALQQPVKKVKELLSSLAAPVPTALSLHEPQTVFLNDEFLVRQELPQPLMTGVNQSDLARESHHNAKAVTQQHNLVDSEFTAATLETKYVSERLCVRMVVSLLQRSSGIAWRVLFL